MTKVKTILSKKNNKVTTAGEHTVGSFIKIEGEPFYRRVNSDGTLTRVSNGDKGTFNYMDRSVPSVVRNNAIRNLGGIHGKDPDELSSNIVNTIEKIRNIAPSGRLYSAVFNSPFVQNYLIRNTEATGELLSEAASIFTGPLRINYYDGKIHRNTINSPIAAQDEYTTNHWNNNRNIVNLFTNQDDTGFEPSKLGVGSYRGTKFEKFPAYEGNYYNIDTLYVSPKSKKFFDSNLNKRFQQDHDVLKGGMTNYEGIDDVQHYGMTPRNINGNYYVDFEDVWDADRGGFNSRNYPFILNQRLPVVFTEDKEKLKITPRLSQWFEQ